MTEKPTLSPKEKVSLAPVPGYQGARPNIILINCDDLGYGDVGAYGNTVIHTPHIDRLARGGVRFTSFYACNSVCTPSRFGLLTGRYADRANLGWVLGAKRAGFRYPGPRSLKQDLLGSYNWWLARQLSRQGFMDYHYKALAKGLPDRELTIADALQTAGYRTAMVGKWHLGEFPVYPQFHPLRHGFDRFFGVPFSNDMKDFALYDDWQCLSPDFTQMDQLTGLYTREALSFIRDCGDQPFFLYFAHTYPHQPLFASERFEGKSKGGRYGDTIEEIDWSVGELMNLLEERHLTEKTLVVFTSDNGPWYNGSTAGLRGRKGQSYEGGFRIPMIAHWPGTIPAGRVCDEPAMNLDWFPTCLALAGLQLPGDRIIDGKDISSLLSGQASQTPHECIYFYHNTSLEALRVGKWKYIRAMNTFVWPVPLDKKWASAGSLEGPWLFDMENDPQESYNLKTNYPEVVKRLDGLYVQWQQAMQANPGGWKKAKTETA